MVTAGNGTALFLDSKNQSHTYSFYSSDVVGAPVTWSASGTAGTGSQQFLIFPADMTLVDIQFHTSNTVTTAFTILKDNVPTGNLISIAAILDTLQKRTFPIFSWQRGRQLTLVQA